MIWVALDAHTGHLALFDRDSGVDLVDAVIASTAMPGLTPTHNINGTRYINGGASGRKRRSRHGLCECRGALAVWRTEQTTSQSVRGPARTTGRGPGKPGRGTAPAGQPGRGNHTGRRFPWPPNGYEPDGSGRARIPAAVPVSPKAKQPASVPLTIARPRPALHHVFLLLANGFRIANNRKTPNVHINAELRRQRRGLPPIMG